MTICHRECCHIPWRIVRESFGYQHNHGRKPDFEPLQARMANIFAYAIVTYTKRSGTVHLRCPRTVSSPNFQNDRIRREWSECKQRWSPFAQYRRHLFPQLSVWGLINYFKRHVNNNAFNITASIWRIIEPNTAVEHIRYTKMISELMAENSRTNSFASTWNRIKLLNLLIKSVWRVASRAVSIMTDSFFFFFFVSFRSISSFSSRSIPSRSEANAVTK